MSTTESLSRTIADTVTISRELREEGQIDGQVKLYNVDDESEFEADGSTFFDRTLMTQGLREAFVDLRDTLHGDENYGTHILYGPYGSGKSHQMVGMYHCFASPRAAGEFGDRHIDGFGDALPDSEDAAAITVSLQDYQPEYPGSRSSRHSITTPIPTKAAGIPTVRPSSTPLVTRPSLSSSMS